MLEVTGQKIVTDHYTVKIKYRSQITTKVNKNNAGSQ